jgi:molybdate transport system ATP-binding protein
VRYIAFCDSYGAATDKSYYLQLRWNQHDIDAETPVVGDVLERSFLLSGPDDSERRSLQNRLYRLFAMEPLLDKYVITLSSGELRKLQLIKTLLARPRTLILDNPFIGLDSDTRRQLKVLLRQLAAEQHLTLYLVLSRADDVPDYVTRTIRTTDEAEFMSAPAPLSDEKRHALLTLPAHADDYCADIVADLRRVSIRYGERTILHNLNWTIRNGERWALSGQNGSGKSTLLSLICADNPQAYACDITLFGRQRGSGESIWDIKKHIGYVSPEMHRSYKRNLPAIRIVASGLMDSIGLYAVPDKNDYDKCRWWLGIFGIEHLAGHGVYAAGVVSRHVGADVAEGGESAEPGQRVGIELMVAYGRAVEACQVHQRHDGVGRWLVSVAQRIAGDVVAGRKHQQRRVACAQAVDDGHQLGHALEGGMYVVDSKDVNLAFLTVYNSCQQQQQT